MYNARATPCNAKLTDVFSIGVLFFVLAFGCPPFSEAKMSDCYFKQLRIRPKGFDLFKFHPYTKELFKENKISESFMKMMLALLAADPKNRV